MDTSRSARLRSAFIFSFAFVVVVASAAIAQSAGKTVRHHKVEDQDPAAAMLAEAESDLDKQDYVSAEPLLKKYVEAKSDNYAAWYDLGFVYHQLGKRDDSIAAYRKSVSAKPDVFESNLNLGLALADTGDPQAQQFLMTATKLSPRSNATQGHIRAWMALGALLENTRPEEAIAAFEEAAKLDARDPEPHLAMGTLFEKQRKF